MTELTIEDKIKLLEIKLIDQKQSIIKVSKYCTWKLVGKYFIPRLIEEQTKHQDTFRELRQLTREAYPERFINSGGNYP
tara:strand:- start:369 stop:605 length:237 start_codon:yes stop_codon:yes gene_type:complete